MSQLITSYFQISGMDCTACAVNIDLDLEEMTGVHSSKTNYAKQTTTVTYDPSLIKIDQITEVIGQSGYQIRLIPELKP